MARLMDELQHLEHWRYCRELNVLQAALLTIEIDPSSEQGAYCEEWKVHERPRGYEAVKTAIANALVRGEIKGRLIPLYEYDINTGNVIDELPGSVDLVSSRVEVGSLSEWFISAGKLPRFFFQSAGAEQESNSAAELESLRQRIEQEQVARESAECRAALAEGEATELRAALEELDEKPVDPRERVTFERLVYTLAREAGYKLEKPSADEAAIQQYAGSIGAMVPGGKGPIAGKLKAAVARFEQDQKDRDA